jgi:ABC-type dipeptide/oligopeptide/nickel transport system permease component
MAALRLSSMAHLSAFTSLPQPAGCRPSIAVLAYARQRRDALTGWIAGPEGIGPVVLLHVLRRLPWMVAVLVSVAIITFVLSHVVPANPAAYMAGLGATQSQVASIQHALGLDKPLPEQFLIYMRGLLHLDLGTSIRTRQPVALELWTYLPATLELIFYSFLLYMILGVALGIIAALKRDSWLDVGIRSFVTVATSLPVFWVGLVLQLIFFVNLGWLPIGGRIGVRDLPPPTITGFYTIDALLTGDVPLFFTVAQHLILPVISITFSLLAVGARLTRATFVEEMDQQYVVTARGKGLPKRRVVFKHILRNALNPILTMSGIQLGYLFSWIVLVEVVFQWPGIGYYAYQSFQVFDYAPIMGLTLMITVFFVVINLIIDLLYPVLDPRVEH